MGLASLDQFRAFCLELSSDQPSPGGGSASAAAGAMAASLLIMVCGVTAKSKKYEGSKARMDELSRLLAKDRDELIRLAGDDARAYDLVVDAIRKRKLNPDVDAEEAFQASLRRAAEIPLTTASLCVSVLEHAVVVAELGTKSASSDVGVAWELANAGFLGATMNVAINIRHIEDRRFVDEASGRLSTAEEKVSRLHYAYHETLRALEPRPSAPKDKGITGH